MASAESKNNDCLDDECSKASFSRNAAKLWNMAPTCIKNAPNLSLAKKEIARYCK